MSTEVRVGYVMEDGSFHDLTVEPDLNGGHIEVFTKLLGSRGVTILPASGRWKIAVAADAALFGEVDANPVLTQLAATFGYRPDDSSARVGALAGRAVFFTVDRDSGALTSLTATKARLLEEAWSSAFRNSNA